MGETTMAIQKTPSHPKAMGKTLHIPSRLKNEPPKRQLDIIAHSSHSTVELLPCGTRVLKTARPSASQHDYDENRRSLLRECDIYTRIPPHSRLLRFYGFSITPASSALVLEYMPNSTLRSYIKSRSSTITHRQRFKWCMQAVEALSVLHRYGVVHGDVRPDNLLVAEDRSLRIVGFGGSATDDRSGYGVEAARYFMPRNDLTTATPDTDRFALGSCLYYIMTGREPRADLSRSQAMAAFARQAYPDVSDLPIADVILRCWRGEYASEAAIYTDLYSLQL